MWTNHITLLILEAKEFKTLNTYKDIMTGSEEDEIQRGDIDNVESNTERISELEKKVERLREEMDFIIERNGLQDLIENE